ncbi:hypothetical protein Q9189_008154 [Teloschistes chrysophthalmus]
MGCAQSRHSSTTTGTSTTLRTLHPTDPTTRIKSMEKLGAYHPSWLEYSYPRNNDKDGKIDIRAKAVVARVEKMERETERGEGSRPRNHHHHQKRPSYDLINASSPYHHRSHHRHQNHTNHFPAPPHHNTPPHPRNNPSHHNHEQEQTSFDTFRAPPPPPVHRAGGQRRNDSKQNVKRRNEERKVEWDVYRKNRMQTVGGRNYF